MLITISLLVSAAVLIQLAVVLWGWVNNTLHESPHETLHRQFDAIVRHLQADTAG